MTEACLARALMFEVRPDSQFVPHLSFMNGKINLARLLHFAHRSECSEIPARQAVHAWIAAPAVHKGNRPFTILSDSVQRDGVAPQPTLAEDTGILDHLPIDYDQSCIGRLILPPKRAPSPWRKSCYRSKFISHFLRVRELPYGPRRIDILPSRFSLPTCQSLPWPVRVFAAELDLQPSSKVQPRLSAPLSVREGIRNYR